MLNQDKLQKYSFLKFLGNKEIELSEISVVQAEPNSWNIGVRLFANGIETAKVLKSLVGESNKTSGLSEILQDFSAKDGWFEYKPGRFVGNLRLLINKNHSDFVEIAVVEDGSEKSNLEIKTFSGERETRREILSFANESKREVASRDLRQKYSHGNGWFLYSTNHGWDSLPRNSNVPVITSYVRFAGVFEDDYEFLEVSNRNEAKNRAEVEFADYSVFDKEANETFAFEKRETQTKALKNSEGSSYVHAFVKAWWWSAYYAVEAVCVDEAEQIFLNDYSTRFSVIGDWDPSSFIDFNELLPQGTSTVHRSSLPLHLEVNLERLEKQIPSTIDFTVADLEWLFFGAINYQLEVLGGTLPAVDYGASGTEFYQKWGRPNFGTEVGIYWPPNQALTRGDEANLLDLFLRYRALWNGDPVYDEFLSLHIGIHFEVQSLKLPNVRQAVVHKLEGQDWGALLYLAVETCRLLGDAPAFVD